MIIFICLCCILGISLDYDIYLNNCAYLTNIIKNYIKYNCIEKFKNMCRIRRERYKLSKTGLRQIKDALFKHQPNFPVSDSIELTTNINYPIYFTNLIPEYCNVDEWTSSDIGDILYIITILKENETSRDFLRIQRCYDLLLDEYIYKLHDSDISSSIYKKLNKYNQKLLKCIMTDLAMTKGEEAKLNKSVIN